MVVSRETAVADEAAKATASTNEGPKATRSANEGVSATKPKEEGGVGAIGDTSNADVMENDAQGDPAAKNRYVEQWLDRFPRHE